MCINYKNVEYVSNHSQATQDSKHYIDKPRKNKLGSLKLFSRYRFYEKVKRERNKSCEGFDRIPVSIICDAYYILLW